MENMDFLPPTSFSRARLTRSIAYPVTLHIYEKDDLNKRSVKQANKSTLVARGADTQLGFSCVSAPLATNVDLWNLIMFVVYKTCANDYLVQRSPEAWDDRRSIPITFAYILIVETTVFKKINENITLL